MTTILSDEDRRLIRESVARLLASRSTEAEVRRVMDTAAGYDPKLWRDIAALGLAGLVTPVEYGGAGGGPLELELVMEEAGAALLCSPLLSSSIFAASLLGLSDDGEVKARLLPGIASGELIAAVAMAGEQGRWTAEDIAVSAVEVGDGWRLQGEAWFVAYGAQADVLLVAARTRAGVGVFEVDPRSAGVTHSELSTLDRTQRLARVDFRNVAGRAIAGAGAEALERALDLARVGLAGEQAGAARRVFDFTIEYLKARVQFGRPIGGFQALKHMAADLLVDVESATSAARQAAASLACGAPDAMALVHLASFACADAFSEVAATSIQMHGGVAFTWEHPAHLYLRRARTGAWLFGSSDFHRDRYVSILEKAQ